ncbi:Senescence/dehydration-associated protein-related [Quillaja saponaria]|uniref:Senescence/dehydration-associated protein-related n=1 Tax=Quillaja saponaria TaxID=32244 RepID=A0AAD7Q2Q2_QUISA|nr:Senescence/dehydration-associated protein-related [Quillaja saponaria]
MLVVQKGMEMIAENRNGVKAGESASNKSDDGTDRCEKNLENDRRDNQIYVSRVGIVTGSVMPQVIKSQAGKTVLEMVPGDVVITTLDSVNKVLDAAENAGKQALSATSMAATRIATDRFGEKAGEAAEKALAAAGYCVGAAWNMFKMRKAI